MGSNVSNTMLGGGAPMPVGGSSGNSFNPPGHTLPGPVTQTSAKSWYEALAKAWGERLDQQADKIVDLASQITDQGQNQPSTVALLTGASQEMMFISSSSSTSTNSVGQALESLARKQ